MKHLKYFESKHSDDYSTWEIGDTVYCSEPWATKFKFGQKFTIGDKREIDFDYKYLITVDGYTLPAYKFTKNIASIRGAKFDL